MIANLEELKKLIIENGNLKFKIKVIANAKGNLVDFCEEFIKIRITARAVDGKANKAIIEYLSDLLNIPKTRIKIASGEKSTIKIIQVEK